MRKGEVGSKSNMSPVPYGDMLRLVEQGDPKACKALDQMAHYLGAGLAMLVTGLAPDVLVVIGEVTRAWKRVGPIVEEAIRKCSTHPCRHAHPAHRLGCMAALAQAIYIRWRKNTSLTSGVL